MPESSPLMLLLLPAAGRLREPAARGWRARIPHNG
jgi:hypothetical protein